MPTSPPSSNPAETEPAAADPIRLKPASRSDEYAEIKRSSVRGGAVTLVSQAVSIFVHLSATVILARLLLPSDYGIVAMVTAITAFAGLFRDLGLSAAAIQKKNLSREQQSNLFWLNVMMGAVLTLVLWAAAPLVAAFYGRPELVPVTMLLSSTFLIGSFGTQHGAMLTRRMQFGRKAFATISGSVVSLAVAATLAWKGWSYWSLVWGTIAAGFTTTVLLFALSPFRPGLPRRGTGVREMVQFGLHLTASDIVNYFSRNLDNILIGKFWGSASMGMYTKAYALLMFPINAIRNPLSSVAFPAMSRLQGDPRLFRSYYRKLITTISFASMPLTVFLFVNSDLLVRLALGEKWGGVVPLFSILAVAAFIQPPASLIGLVSMSLQRGKVNLRVNLFSSVVTCIGFAVGVKWGAVGVAVSYAVTRYLCLIPALSMAFAGTPLSLKDFFGAIIRPAAASICTGLVVYGMRPVMDAGHAGINFVSSALIFAAVFAGLVALMPEARKDVAGWVELFKSSFLKKRK